MDNSLNALGPKAPSGQNDEEVGLTASSTELTRHNFGGTRRMNGPCRRAVVLGLLAAVASRAAQAAGWPERPVTWVVPFPPGGSTDTFARPIAELVGSLLGQPIVINHQSGAGGTMAAALFTRAAPDGYTLLVGNTGLTYAPTIYPKAGAGFDFARDFAPVSALAREPFALIVNPSRVHAGTLQEFIAVAKASPGSVEVGSDGRGTVSNLAVDALEVQADIKLKHVPFQSSIQKLDKLRTGQVDAAFDSPGAAADHVKAGKLRVLAIAGRRREALLPDVPTFTEAGLNDFLVSQWFGLFAPKRTPEPILDRMHGAVQAALGDVAINRLWVEHGAKVELESRADFTRFVGLELVRWTRIAKAANLQLD